MLKSIQRILILLFLFDFYHYVYAQETELEQSSSDEKQDVKYLLIGNEKFKFLSKYENELIAKTVLNVAYEQKEYHLTLGEEEVGKGATKASLTRVNIKINRDKGPWEIVASLVDEKSSKIVKRIFKRNSSKQSAIRDVDLATRLLFSDLAKKIEQQEKQALKYANKATKDKKQGQSLNTSSTLDKDAIDFKQRVLALRKDVQSELKKSSSSAKDSAEEKAKKSNQENKSLSAVVSAEDLKDQNKRQTKIFNRNFNAEFFYGKFNSSYEIKDRVNNPGELTITTNVDFLGLGGEATMQTFSYTPWLNALVGFGFGYPLSGEAEVPLQKYSKIYVGAELTFLSFMGTYLRAAMDKEKMSFANIPEFGLGIRMAEVSASYLALELYQSIYEKLLVFRFKMKRLLSADYEADYFSSGDFTSSQSSYTVELSISKLIPYTALFAEFSSTTFTSSGDKEGIQIEDPANPGADYSKRTVQGSNSTSFIGLKHRF